MPALTFTLNIPSNETKALEDALDNDSSVPSELTTYQEKGSFIIDKLLRNYVKETNGAVAVANLNAKFKLDKENAKKINLSQDFLTIT